MKISFPHASVVPLGREKFTTFLALVLGNNLSYYRYQMHNNDHDQPPSRHHIIRLFHTKTMISLCNKWFTTFLLRCLFSIIKTSPKQNQRINHIFTEVVLLFSPLCCSGLIRETKCSNFLTDAEPQNSSGSFSFLHNYINYIKQGLFCILHASPHLPKQLNLLHALLSTQPKYTAIASPHST